MKFWAGVIIGTLVIAVIVGACAYIGATAHGLTFGEFFTKLANWITYTPTVRSPL